MKINKMPTKEMLEAYLEGSRKQPVVVFDIEKGEFVYVAKRNHSKLEGSVSSTNNQITA